MDAARTLLLSTVGLAAGLLGGCAIFLPIKELPAARFQNVWATKLYDLEMLAYEPVERGQPLHIKRGDEARPAGLVVVPSRDRRVRALDGASGHVVWSLETEGSVVARPVLADPDSADVVDLILASMDGRVYRVGLADGAIRWQADVPARSSIITTPTVYGAGGMVFVTTIDNRISALSLKDGSRVWDKRRPHRGDFTVTGQAGATVVGDSVLTGFSDGTLVSFAVADGATEWTQDLSMGADEFVDVDTTPLLVGDVVIAGSYKNGLFGLEADGGDLRWRIEGEGFGTPAEHEGVVYAPRADGRLFALSAETGDILWIAAFETGIPVTPAVSQKYVLVPIGESLLALDRVTGRAVQRFDDMYGFSATPDVAWGTVYAASNSGVIYAVGLR